MYTCFILVNAKTGENINELFMHSIRTGNKFIFPLKKQHLRNIFITICNVQGVCVCVGIISVFCRIEDAC